MKTRVFLWLGVFYFVSAAIASFTFLASSGRLPPPSEPFSERTHRLYLPLVSVSAEINVYSVQKVGNQYHFFYGNHHFLTVISNGNEFVIRPHPGVDKNGWGSSWYAQSFLPNAILRNANLTGYKILEGRGIWIGASGKVSRDQGSTYGTWDINLNFSYNREEKKVVGTGDYHIVLDAPLSYAGDLNLFKIASNYLNDVPLLSGGVGNTGDMSEVKVVGNNFNFTWLPPERPAHFPMNMTSFLSIDVKGQFNNVDTAAQGYAPIKPAYKPSLRVTLFSTEPDLEMIFGGIYDLEKSQHFWEDNVGITPLILKSSRRMEFFFTLGFESRALPGDGSL